VGLSAPTVFQPVKMQKNQTKRGKKRKSKTINDEIRPIVGNQTQQVFVSFIFPQVDTFSKGIFESDGDSTVEFLRVERTPSEAPLNREDWPGRK
jgi:hypothetical protein